MSVSSNIRKESTESYAAQQMHSTMGLDPALSQLNDKDLDNELPSRLNDRANNTTVAEDVAQIDDTVAEADSENQPAAATDETVVDEAKPTHVADADWNQSTEN